MPKKIALSLALLVLVAGMVVFTGCDIVTGSGETQTFEMDYADFTRVEISTGFDVEITRADAFFISITVDKSLYEYLTIAQRGDTLLVGLKSNYTYTAASRQAVIHMPDLRRLQLSGNSKAVVTGFSVTHTVDFNLSGASVLTISPIKTGDSSFVLSGGSTASGSIEMNNGNFNVSEASSLTLTGKAAGLKINGSGGSILTLEEFPVPTASVALDGASRAVIAVSDILDVNLSGGSNLQYTGTPKLGSMKISGGSKLNQK